MKILVLNAGSSSLKYAVIELPTAQYLLTGLIDNINNYTLAFNNMLHELNKEDIPIAQLNIIAHRVVHGGQLFQQATLITSDILIQLKQLIPLAPLHNPANILGIETALKYAPNTIQIAVFDTAFHYTMPDIAYRYAIPNDWYQTYHIRRYGFHGSSHSYIAKQAALLLNKPLNELNIISLHLGNGASACAIKNGQSIDTSMGFSPLEGLIMGTRCGDIDSSICAYIAEHNNLSSREINTQLNNDSGLKAIAETHDMRTIEQLINEGNKNALLAFNLFCYRIKKYIGAYYAIIGKLDALVFTGGIGENSINVRAQCCADLTHLGLMIDNNKNKTLQSNHAFIHDSDYHSAILVIKTDEALEIATQAFNLIQAKSSSC